MDITRSEYGTLEKYIEFVRIAVEFTGGLELLFSNQRKHQLSLPAKDEDGQTANMAFLVRYLCQHLIKDRREELFVMDGTVRPGILVLINDADWELEGENSYELQTGDNVLSTYTVKFDNDDVKEDRKLATLDKLIIRPTFLPLTPLPKL